MEVTAAERTAIYTNISPLAQRVNNYIQTQHSSIAAVAKDIGYSRTTVSRYLTGKYDSNPNDLESKLTDFLTRQTGEAVDLTTPLAKSEGKTWQTPVFFESRDAKAVLGVCQSCQEYIGLGIVVARSGYGKTYALRQYAKLSRVAYIECDDTMSSRDLVEAIERSIGLPNGYGTIWRRVNGIREFFNTNKGYLLIIDEADKLVSKYTQKKMEILRAVFDQSDVGLVIAGEPKLEAQIKTYLVRMANRVDFYASLRGLSPSEVEGYGLLANGFTEKCYDGKAFFATDHPVGKDKASNKGTAKLSMDAYKTARTSMMSLKNSKGRPLALVPDLLVVPPALEADARDILVADFINGTKNTMQGTAEIHVEPRLASDSAWFLLCTKRPVKPLIYQQRKKAKFVSKTNETDDNVFMSKKFIYGADSRGNAGFGFWQMAYGSDGTTT